MKVLLTLVLISFSITSHAFIPEASGGTKVGSMLVISGDEEPASLWIGEDAESVEKTKVKGAKWDDMEGLAQVSESAFFGMTSHSMTKKGKRKPEREQLILFSMKGAKIEAQKSFSLREAMLSYLKKNVAVDIDVATNGTPDEGGLNVEGLAFLNGKLYFGLRAPLTKDKKAIVLEVSNPESAPEISQHMTINLGGNGIRSLETDGGKLIVIGGSTDDADKAFSLHHYLPARAGVLTSLNIDGFSELLRPESLIVETDALIFLQDFQEEAEQEVIVRLQR